MVVAAAGLCLWFAGFLVWLFGMLEGLCWYGLLLCFVGFSGFVAC